MKEWKAGNCEDCRHCVYHQLVVGDFCEFHNEYIGEMIDNKVTEFFDPNQRLTCPRYSYKPYTK